MSVENKVAIILICLITTCFTILYVFLFLSLWEYRQYVGLSLMAVLLGAFVLWRIVDARGKLTEQEVRRERYRQHEEIPLDLEGEPMYWPQGAQPNPYRKSPQDVTHSYQYQQQQRVYRG